MAESASGEMLGVEQMHDGLAGEYRRPKFINSGARRGMVTEYGEQFEVVVGGGMHDPMYGMLSPEFRNAVAHLRVHIDRARRQLDTTVNLLAQFAKLQARVEPFLADLVVEPAPVRAALTPIPPTPRSLLSGENKSTGMNEWCPIASMREPEPVDDGVTVTPLGDNAGLRVTSGQEVRPGDPVEREKKIIGITGGA